MKRQKLARKLVENSPEDRDALLKKHRDICDAELARQLQQVCYEVWTSHPQKVAAVVETLREIYALTKDDEVRAYSKWSEAIENLVNGKLDECLELINDSASIFRSLKNYNAAASTQTSKLYALALLGRYDEAVNCGLQARDIFLAENDLYSLGKIEHNIGNLFWRRDLYRESEPYLESAHQRFTEVGDQRQLAMVENCQAFVKALQNDFRRAASIYDSALKRAEENNLTVTEAEIGVGLSNLYLFQGKLDLALKFMEGSRRKYEILEMPLQTANCELEIADIYLELNLWPEAIDFYEKVEAAFSSLGMRAEMARAFFGHARALFFAEPDRAAEYLERSGELYEAEGNEILAAHAKLVGIQIRLDRLDPEKAETDVRSIIQTFKKGGNRRHELFAQWLLGEILVRQERIPEARRVFLQALDAAADLRQIEYQCLVSLGMLENGESYLMKAVEIVENSRTAFSSTDFRTAFFSDKILPYHQLAKTKLAQNKPREAFAWHERSRGRSLFDALNSVDPENVQSARLDALRDELNWFHNRLNRQTASGLKARKQVRDLKKHARKLEKDYAELARREQINARAQTISANEFEISSLQKKLGETVLVEFAEISGKLYSFVVTTRDFEVREVNDYKLLQTEVQQFLFQIKTARLMHSLSSRSLKTSNERMLRHAQKLYDLLFRPIQHLYDREALKIIPSGILHYLPIHALHNGGQFLIETNEISYAPSAAIYENCLSRNVKAFDTALLVGLADKRTPLVKTEIETLRKLFTESTELFGDQATLENLSRHTVDANILHLACHGNFRPDNAEFSSLALFEGELSVRQAQKLDLRDKFVVLSACETGLNQIVSGEELIGLTRGFLSAGAASLLLSLWAVNDKSTLELMEIFYRRIIGGESPGKALQKAQIQILENTRDPYFWAPFVLIGK